MDLRKFAVRSAVAVVFGPLILFLSWFGGIFLLALVLTIVSFGVYEFYRMSESKESKPQFAFGIILANIICVLYYANFMHNLWLILAVAVVLMLIYELFRNLPNPLLNLSLTLGGVVYVALLFGFLLLIRSLPQAYNLQDSVGGHLVIMLFVTIWLCDSAAYILGSKIGRHKIFPRVSPNKTVEGTLAGFVTALLSAYVYGYYLIPEINVWHLVVLGAICGSVGQLSDLTESLFKRDAGVKDSSNLIPGHGGILDRFDSEILVVPLAYCYLVYAVL